MFEALLAFATLITILFIVAAFAFSSAEKRYRQARKHAHELSEAHGRENLRALRYQKQVDDLEKTLANVKRNSADKSAQIGRMLKSGSKIREELEAKSAALDSLKTLVDTMRACLSETEQSNSAHLEYIGNLQSEIKSLEADKTAQQYEVEALQSELGKLSSVIEALDKGRGFDFTKYQFKAKETAIYPNQGGFLGLVYACLGLANEAGEVAGKVKKIMRQGRGIEPADVDKLVLELGDVLWYLAAAAQELKTPLAEVASRNLAKLESRQDRGTLEGEGDNR